LAFRIRIEVAVVFKKHRFMRLPAQGFVMRAADFRFSAIS
jgi:hypothetical protein